MNPDSPKRKESLSLADAGFDKTGEGPLQVTFCRDFPGFAGAELCGIQSRVREISWCSVNNAVMDAGRNSLSLGPAYETQLLNSRLTKH